MNKPGKNNQSTGVGLKNVAEYTGLTPGTVSAVLNSTPSARSVPQHTKDRIFAAARTLNYRPNYIARALRNKRTYTLAVLAGDIGEPWVAYVMSGIERYLRDRDYFFFLVACHRNDPAELERCSDALAQRGVEGLIALGTDAPHSSTVPAIAVDIHQSFDVSFSDWRTHLQDQGQNAAELLLDQIEGRSISSSSAADTASQSPAA